MPTEKETLHPLSLIFHTSCRECASAFIAMTPQRAENRIKDRHWLHQKFQIQDSR